MPQNNYVKLFLKGLMMGTADVIPGISGSTVALVLGIYREFIDALKAIKPAPIAGFLGSLPLATHTQRTRARTHFLQLRLNFLLPLFLGISASFMLASLWIPPLLRHYPSQMHALFFGIVVVAVYVPFSKIERHTASSLLAFTLCTLFAFYLVQLPHTQGASGSLFTYACGVLAIGAMLLPGISGSFLLQALGQYEYMLTQLHQAFMLDSAALWVVFIFCSGCLSGIVVFSRVLSYALHHHRNFALSMISGCMLGAARAVWPFAQVPSQIGSFEISCLGFVALGAFFTSVLIYVERTHSLRAQQEA